jgi:hypothetical protein
VALLDSQGGINENGFFVSGNESRGHVRPCVWNSEWQRLLCHDGNEFRDMKVGSQI